VNGAMQTAFQQYLTNEIQSNSAHLDYLRCAGQSPVVRAVTRGRIEALKEALVEFNRAMATEES
jgi:hypothetical protein